MADSTADNRSMVNKTFGTTTIGSTKWLELAPAGKGGRNFFDISIQDSGSGSISIDLERKRQGEADGKARLVATFGTEVEQIAEMAGSWLVRLTVTIHNVSSDLDCELSVI